MKIHHLIAVAAVAFATGCDTPSSTTGTASTSGNTTASGTTTSGNTNATGTTTSPGSTSAPASTTSPGNNNASGNNNATTSPAATTAPGTTQSATPGSTPATTAPANNNNNSSANPGSTTAEGSRPSAPGTTSSMNNNNNSSSANQSGSVANVPASTQSAFATRYPQASNVQWSRFSDVTVPIDWDLTDWPVLDNDDYVVRYNVGTDPYYAWYDSGGNWIGSSMTLKNMSALPAPVSQLLTSKYAGYTVSSANMEYWKDRSAYEIEMKGAGNKVKLLVDANGNIIKQKTKPL